MNCLIVDDEKVSRKTVEFFAEKVDNLRIIKSCNNPIDAANILKKEKIDIVFLDIEMPEMSGLDFIETMTNKPQIILITSKEEYAVEAFKTEVTDYLLKPVDFKRFLTAVNRAVRNLKQNQNTRASLFIKDRSKYIKINYEDIHYIEASRDYMNVVTLNRKIVVSSTLKELQEKLDGNKFVRVHRSYIVNIDKIIDLEETNLVIDSKIIPISKTYKKNLMDKLNIL